MKEPQPRDSQNRIIEPSDYRYITIGTARCVENAGHSSFYPPLSIPYHPSLHAYGGMAAAFDLVCVTSMGYVVDSALSRGVVVVMAIGYHG